MSQGILTNVRRDLAMRRAAGEPFLDAWQAAVAAVQGRERDVARGGCADS